MITPPATEPRVEANQTVRLHIDRDSGPSAIRICFTDQRLSAHGGLIVWWHFLHQKKFRRELSAVLPHEPTSPNAYAPADIALGYLGGILAGADKLSRVARLTRPVQKLCRHDDAHWSASEVPGLQVQEIEAERPGRRLILLRTRIAERPQSGGKKLLEVPGYRFQALVTKLPRSVDALGVWRRYNGRADIEPSGAR